MGSLNRTRRSLLQTVLAGLAGSALPALPAIGQPAARHSVTSVRDGVSVLHRGTGPNVLTLTTGEGLVLVDTGAPVDQDALLATLSELTEDVIAVFNTHWHPDQVGANEALGAAGATIFAHEKTRIRLNTGYYVPDEDRYIPRLDSIGVPTETIYDSATVAFGNESIAYGHLIEAHTDGDIYVALQDRNVIAVGDVLTPGRDPELDWFGGGWLGGRVDAIAKLLEMSDADTLFVPGTGPVVDRNHLQAEHDLLSEVFERMVERVRLGETPRDMLEAGVLDGLSREFEDPFRLLYDLQKGFWAHHNALMHDIV